MDSIIVENLSKEYKTIKRTSGMKGAIKTFFHPQYESKMAVDGISFSIPKGKIVGFIGPNGAGKSTTIKMLVGILAPTSGSVRVEGLNPYKDRKKNANNYGIVFGQRTQLWWDIPIEDTFLLLKDMYKVTDKDYKDNVELFSEILDIQSILKKPTRQLSLGQRMRADLFAALLHNPPILFLDEPTIGLDVAAKDSMRNFIKTVNDEKKTTIILTTHDVSDIEELSHDIMVIDSGKIIYEGSLDMLKLYYGGKTNITISMDQKNVNRIREEYKRYPILIHNVDGGVGLEFESKEINKTKILSEIFTNYNISGIKITETSVEDIIKKIYKHNLKPIKYMAGENK